MKTIWKYPLDITDSQVLTIPKGAHFLSVIEQSDIPVLYALVNPSLPTEQTEVLIRGTGHPIDEAHLPRYVFLGTVGTHSGTLVWHIFVESRSK